MWMPKRSQEASADYNKKLLQQKYQRINVVTIL